MELPIVRKNHRYPKDFIDNIEQATRRSNLYTFNPTSSVHDSAINQREAYSFQPNPEQPQQDSNPAQRRTSQHKIYFDAQVSNGDEIVINNQKQAQNSKKRGANLQLNSRSKYENNQNNQVLQTELENEQLSRNKFSQSGMIIKQRRQESPLSEQKQSRISQKQFNRLALSLIGVKRTKFNKSCLQKKSSFVIHQIQSPKKSSNKGKSNNTNYFQQKQQSDNQIYEHTAYPFRTKKIQQIMSQINKISGKSRMRRSYVKPNQNNFMNQFMPQQNGNSFLKYSQLQRVPKLPQIKISIKTSLSQLKNLLSENLKQKQVSIQVPQFMVNPPSQFGMLPQFNPQVLTNQSMHIFSNLQIPIMSITIRKYSNCVVVLNHTICIVWHWGQFGNKYVGSWANKYFDQGHKEGLGLQWAPQRYIYYGQFANNKRNGFGVMIKSHANTLVGYWKNGKYLNFGIQKNYHS